MSDTDATSNELVLLVAGFEPATLDLQVVA